MKFIQKLGLVLFGFFWIELNQQRFSSKHKLTEIAIEYNDQKRKKHLKKKQYKNQKWKKKKEFKKKNLALKGTHSKDSRYSNHQKIRRMYRNS